MKPAKSGTRKQRIILYYTIAVVIPGVILGFMAYRGGGNAVRCIKDPVEKT